MPNALSRPEHDYQPDADHQEALWLHQGVGVLQVHQRHDAGENGLSGAGEDVHDQVGPTARR